MSRVLLFLVLAACSKTAESPPNATPVPAAATKQGKDPAAAKQLIERGAVVIDVRTAEEFATGHVPSATNIPVDELGDRLPEVTKLTGGDVHKPVVVYCASGHRAGKAQAQLAAAGYTQVVNGGGLDDLQ